MKYLPTLTASLTLFLGVGLFVAHAQGYVPLAPLPGTTITDASGVQRTDIATYVSGMIKLFIAVGASLAILFAIIGGTQYVAASINPVAKQGALEKVQNALIGLAIILSSYLVLNSIDPKLVEFNLSLAPVTSTRLEPTVSPYVEQMSASSCPVGVSCVPCVGCSSIPASIPNKGCGVGQCFLETSLLQKIKNVQSLYPTLTGWRITESWPPTVKHLSSCHTNGSCADLNNSNGQTVPSVIKVYYDAFTAAGLDVTYESTDCAPYIAYGITNCASYDTMTNASSFHVK